MRPTPNFIPTHDMLTRHMTWLRLSYPFLCLATQYCREAMDSHQHLCPTEYMAFSLRFRQEVGTLLLQRQLRRVTYFELLRWTAIYLPYISFACLFRSPMIGWVSQSLYAWKNDFPPRSPIYSCLQWIVSTAQIEFNHEKTQRVRDKDSIHIFVAW